MKVKEMINTLPASGENILIRDENNYNIGLFPQYSEALNPYLERNVAEWFPGCPPDSRNVSFVIILTEEQENE